MEKGWILLNGDLELLVKELKLDILRMFYHSGTGHLASALSCIEMLSVLYFWKHDEKDRIVLSKGHGAGALYPILAKIGEINREELKTFYGYNSRLFALASHKTPGIEVSTGSLGQGMCFSSGLAKAYQLNEEKAKVFCILGDGEMQEGCVWEAAMFAAAQKLDNFAVFLDYNGIQASERVQSIMKIEPIREKWKAFGWHVEEIDGHNIASIQKVVQDFRDGAYHKPLFVIAHTHKGHGISFIEDRADCHMLNPKNEEWETVCREFHISLEELNIS